MEKYNNRHSKYMSTITFPVKVLFMDETFKNDPLQLLHKIANSYNAEITKGCKDYETLNIFYTALCYEYQYQADNLSIETNNRFPDFSETVFTDIVKIIIIENDERPDEKFKNLILDIIVLQVILYCNVATVNKIFKHLLNSKELFEKNNDENEDLFFELADCLLDSLYLNSSLKDELLVNSAYPVLFGQMNSWFLTAENLNWKLFVQILNKLINVFDNTLVLPNIWEMVLNYKHDDWEKPLTLLCTIINDVLSETVIALNIGYLNTQDKLWQLIIWGITSKVEQSRKQALYTLKVILDFVEKHKMIPFVPKVVPFVYCPQYDQQLSPKEMMNNFFLILESLEEKQAHLITPVLKHLEDLIQFSNDHVSCHNCLDSKWIACIIERVLEHKTNSVIKFGVMSLLKINPTFYTEQLLSLLLKGLNNTFLYNNLTLNSNPVIVRKLSELFISAENSRVDLMNRFICAASEITWTPIPSYYSIISLRKTAIKLSEVRCNVFTNKELKCIIEIIEKSFKLHSSDFRNVLFESFYIMFGAFATKPLDLGLFASFSYFFINCSKIQLWRLIKYIKINIQKDDAINYLRNNCEKISLTQPMNEMDIKVFAATLVILHDAQLILDLRSDDTRQVLNNVFKLILDADVRPYLDKNQCLNVMQFIHSLLVSNQINFKDDSHKFFDLIIPYLECVKKLIFKSLQHNVHLQSFNEAKIYVECFSTIVKYYRVTPNNESDIYKIFGQEAFYLINSYDELGELKNIKYWFGLNIAVLCMEFEGNIFSGESLSNYIKFFNEVTYKELDTSKKSDSNCNSGKIISDCYQLTVELLEKFLKSHYRRINEEISPRIFFHIKEFTEIGKEHVTIPIINILQFLLKKRYDVMISLINESDIVNLIIDSAFMYLWDLKRDQLYWSSLDKLLKFILDDNFFKIDKGKEVTIKHMENVISQSHNIIKIKYLLLQNILNNSLTSVHFYQTLISNFLDANLGENDIKIKMQTYNHISSQHNTHIFESGYVDVQFRAKTVVIFMKILKTAENYITIENIFIYLISILKKYENKRYFENSNIHRIKYRVMQLLLLLHPFLEKEERKELHDFIGNLIISESNQPTVRMMQEWLLIKTYLNDAEMQPLVWELLTKGKDVRPGSTTSLASIVYHVCRQLPIDQKKIYTKVAISKLFSSCLSQKFVVRLYCQVILTKIINMIPQQLPSVDYELIKEAIEESMHYGNLRENSLKLSDEFYFTLFDPIKDFTIESIFYEFPRLLHMTIDECIPLKIFRCNNLEYITIPENNTDSKLWSLEPTFHSPRNRCEGFEDSVENNISTDNDNPVDIQKKIIPWKSMIPANDDLSRVPTIRQQKLADDTGIIVVASLIDGMPNLGGLARTAEIFCAKELVLGSLRYTENREFQTLSVSADKWIKITEVKAHELRNYLLEKSSMGWTLVGAEQTTNSINLLEMKFDKKTVLILGNEKSGIPADLISLLDVCVEIPQAGVVRSLNVHVTGAICMWQYAQQHIF